MDTLYLDRNFSFWPDFTCEFKDHFVARMLRTVVVIGLWLRSSDAVHLVV